MTTQFRAENDTSNETLVDSAEEYPQPGGLHPPGTPDKRHCIKERPILDFDDVQKKWS